MLLIVYVCMFYRKDLRRSSGNQVKFESRWRTRVNEKSFFYIQMNNFVSSPSFSDLDNSSPMTCYNRRNEANDARIGVLYTAV